ncbi:MAG: hypothetical protein GWP19_06360 [Planctomycetia bacterium]|nr:hypothetical protein [Planctomycetia bacterium]
MKNISTLTECKMPLLAVDNLKANYLASSLISNGEHLLPQENIYLKVFIRLVDKACNEYNSSRELLLEQIDEIKNGEERGYRTIFIFGFWDHIENCINAIKRIYLIFDKIISVRGKLEIDRTERKLIKNHQTIIKNLRNTVEHIDKELQSIDTYTISISSTQDGVSISSYEIKFISLFNLLRRFNEIGKKWINIYSMTNILE